MKHSSAIVPKHSFVGRFFAIMTAAGMAAAIAHSATLDVQLAAGVNRLIVGDFDGDQKSDLLLQGAAQREHTIALTGAATAELQRWRDGFMGFRWNRNDVNLIAGDFNGDASSDLFLQSKTPKLTSELVIAYADGRLGVPSQTFGDFELGVRWDGVHHNILVGDFDGDNRDDLFLQGIKNVDRHALALSDQKGEFHYLPFDFDNAHLNFDWSAQQTQLHPGDFDGDGKWELLAQPKTAGNVYHVSSDRHPFDTLAATLPERYLDLDWSAAAHRVVVGDFNGDIRDDVFLLATRSDTISAYVPSTTQGFKQIEREFPTIPNLEKIAQILVGDFDSDGIDELVLVYQDGKLAPAVLMASERRRKGLEKAFHKLGLLAKGQSLTILAGQRASGLGDAGARFPGVKTTATTNMSLSSTTNLASVPEVGNAEPGWQEFGLSSGAFRVDESGGANYDVPIATAPGAGGITPKLALHYSSKGGNGPVGMGWSINGLSAIARCRKTKETEGVDGAVNYDANDAFCLDGQKLVMMTSAPPILPKCVNGVAPTSWYRTEIDSGTLVGRCDSSVATNPAQFVVARKDGSLSYYGTNNGGLVHWTNAISNVADTNKTTAWLLNRFEDAVGNYVDYAYLDDNLESLPSTATFRGGQIIFNYETRTDKRTNYSIGAWNRMTKRLASINSKDDLGNTIRDYTLKYLPAGAGSVSRLEYLQECRGTICLPAMKFDWQPNPEVYQARRGAQKDFDHRYVGGKLADINGDGKQDQAYVWRNGEGDAFWVETRFAEKIGAEHQLTYRGAKIPIPDAARSAWHLFDYNGDGRLDLLSPACKAKTYGRGCEIVSNWGVFVAAADGSYPNIEYAPTTGLPGQIDTKLAIVNGEESELADFNGDSLPDLIWPSVDSKKINVSLLKRPGQDGHVCADGSITLPTSTRPYCFGNAMLIEPVIAQSFKFYPEPEEILYCYEGLSIDGGGREHSTVTDINGDSFADIYVDVVYSMRAGTLACSDPPSPTYVTFKRLLSTSWDGAALKLRNSGSYDDVSANFYPTKSKWLRLVDMNGDGLSDRLHRYGESDNRWFISYNTGKSFTQPTLLGAIEKDDRLQTFDLNNDGLVDILYPQDTTVGYKAMLAKGDGTFAPAINSGFAYVGDDREDFSEMFGDFDGDGLVDRLALYHDGEDGEGDPHSGLWIDTNAQSFQTRNVIAEIRNSFGAVTKLTYKPLTDSSVYTKGTGAAAQQWGQKSPVIDILAPIYVVAEVKSSAPAANSTTAGNIDYSATSSVRYQYAGLRMQAGGRGSLGFASITSTDPQTGVKSTTSYWQEFPYTGLPSQTTKKTADGLVTLHSAVNTRAKRSGLLGGEFPYVYKVEETTRDLNNAFISNALTTTTYDDSANVSTQMVHVRDMRDSDLITVVQNKYTSHTYGSTVIERFYGRLSKTTASVKRDTLAAQTGHCATNTDECVKRESSFIYNHAKRLLTDEIIEPNGNAQEYLRTHYEHDSFGNRVRSTVCSQHIGNCGSDTTQDPSNALWINRSSAAEFDPLGRYVQKTRNHYGQLLQEIKTRNTLHQPTSIAGATGVTATAVYSDFGRPSSEFDGIGASKTTEMFRCADGCAVAGYMPNGALYRITQTTTSGTIVHQFFDVLGREIAALSRGFKENDWIRKLTEYDNLNRVFRYSQPHMLGASTVYWNVNRYDILGRLYQTDKADGSKPRVEHNGLTTTFYNELNQKKIEIRNALGELETVTDNLDHDVAYKYHVTGQLLSLTRVGIADKLQSKMNYDKLGRKLAMWDADKSPTAGNAPDGVTQWSYGYNALGNQIEQTDPRGYRISTRYDPLGRTVARDEKDANGVVLSGTTWVFDNTSSQSKTATQLLLETDRVSGYERQFEHDGFGRANKTTYRFDGHEKSESVAFDTLGRPWKSTDATGQTVETVYHPITGFVSAVRDANKTTEVFQKIDDMDAWGHVIQETAGNGVVTTRGYHPVTGRLGSITSTRNGVSIQQLSYQWDLLGNLRQRIDLSTGKNLVEDIEYDAMNRLYESTVTTGGLSEKLNIDYDAEGNITRKSDVFDGLGDYIYGQNCNGSAVVAGPHAVICAKNKTQSYSYDKNGNQIGGNGRSLMYDTAVARHTDVVLFTKLHSVRFDDFGCRFCH